LRIDSTRCREKKGIGMIVCSQSKEVLSTWNCMLPLYD
jgi:hypothetical protein